VLLLHSVDVHGDLDDSVRVMAGQVRPDAVLGDDGGFIGAGAGATQ
jgi:hypothetical protein